MIDDMGGLYSHASEAYRAGRRAGQDDFYRAARSATSEISSKHGTAGSVEKFHAAEECCAAILAVKRALAAPSQESIG
jgi:hypothetical protein